MEELSDITVRLLGLGSRRDFARADGPHGFVCNHDLAADHANIGHQSPFSTTGSAPPVSLFGELDNRLKLSFDHLGALARLTLRQG